MAESSSSQEKPAEQSKFDQDNIPKPSKMVSVLT